MIKTLALPCKASNLPFGKVRRSNQVKAGRAKMELSITKPDDWHLHLRDGDLLEAVVSHSAHNFGRAVIMPNLRPPITTTAAAMAYHESILKVLPNDSDFIPLMTLYLTDSTSPHEIKLARESGVVFAVKLYPAGATTNSQDGVTDLFGKCVTVLEEMVEQNMPLLVHGEVTDPDVDIFDREKVFIDTVLRPLVQKFPQLKVVMEHVTTMDAVRFVESCAEDVDILFDFKAYCQDMLLQLLPHNIFFSTGIPSSKEDCSHTITAFQYLKERSTAGALDKLEAFTSFNGPDFYGLPRNTSKVKLNKTPWQVPKSFRYACGEIIPMSAGETLDWLPETVSLE